MKCWCGNETEYVGFLDTPTCDHLKQIHISDVCHLEQVNLGHDDVLTHRITNRKHSELTWMAARDRTELIAYEYLKMSFFKDAMVGFGPTEAVALLDLERKEFEAAARQTQVDEAPPHSQTLSNNHCPTCDQLTLHALNSSASYYCPKCVAVATYEEVSRHEVARRELARRESSEQPTHNIPESLRWADVYYAVTDYGQSHSYVALNALGMRTMPCWTLQGLAADALYPGDFQFKGLQEGPTWTRIHNGLAGQAAPGNRTCPDWIPEWARRYEVWSTSQYPRHAVAVGPNGWTGVRDDSEGRASVCSEPFRVEHMNDGSRYADDWGALKEKLWDPKWGNNDGGCTELIHSDCGCSAAQGTA